LCLGFIVLDDKRITKKEKEEGIPLYKLPKKEQKEIINLITTGIELLIQKTIYETKVTKK